VAKRRVAKNEVDKRVGIEWKAWPHDLWARIDFFLPFQREFVPKPKKKMEARAELEEREMNTPSPK
jgi:hypothetical protein